MGDRNGIGGREDVWDGEVARSMDAITEVLGYRALAAGWDGEHAAAPSAASICDAVAFLRTAAGAAALSPSLHVAGDVLVDDDASGVSLRFLGNGRVVWAGATGHGTASLEETHAVLALATPMGKAP